MKELQLSDYTWLRNAMRSAKFDFWYGSPELWCCQDYPTFFSGSRLMNEQGQLMVPPLDIANMNDVLNKHLKEMGHCDILFAPHYIETLIHPLVFSLFNIEQVDNNYINDCELVASLKGGKLKKLRNNVTNFPHKQELIAKPLAVKDIPDAIKLVEKYHCVSNEFDDIAYNTKILEGIGAFNLFHRGYWLDGEMVAFNVGAELSERTASFIISKSRHDIKYLVDYVRWDFHRQMLEEDMWFVNDGSDLDSEGLAQLKRKFAPLGIMPVYELEWEG